MVDYNLQSLTSDDVLLRLGVYSASQRPQIVDAFADLRARPFCFGLCHNDLNPGNVMTTLPAPAFQGVSASA